MNKICLIIAAIFFGIGAFAAALKLNFPFDFVSAGLCMVTIAAIVGH